MRLLVNHFHQSGFGGVQAARVRETLRAHDGRRIHFFGSIKVFECGSLLLNFAWMLPLEVHVDLMSYLAVSFYVTVRSMV
jgi:hypothetical protein